MEAKIETNTVMHLQLTLGEAAWLRAVMQNPIYKKEDEVDKEFRLAFFEATSKRTE